MSMQYGVAASQAPAAIEQLRASEFSKSNPSRVLEIKFLKGSDQSYLGPNAGYDSILFNTWWLVDDAVKLKVFDPFENVMQRLGARPHWGKLHRRPDIEYLRAVYPGWDSFEAVRTRFDPNQMFATP
jgi:xylitol oxidase